MKHEKHTYNLNNSDKKNRKTIQTGQELAMSVIITVVILGAYISDLVRRLNGETNQFVDSVDGTVSQQNEILRALDTDMTSIREAFPGNCHRQCKSLAAIRQIALVDSSPFRVSMQSVHRRELRRWRVQD